MNSLASHRVPSNGENLCDNTVLQASANNVPHPVQSLDEYTASIRVYLLQHPDLDMFERANLVEKVKYKLKRNYNIDWSYYTVRLLLDMLPNVVAEGL